MTIFKDKLLRPRKVFISKDIGLIDFYKKVKVVLFNHKIFVSQKMFQEQWDLCQKSSGKIKVVIPKPKRILYGFDYKTTSGCCKIMFCVNAETQGFGKIQLMFLKEGKTKYQYEKQPFQDVIFLEKAKEKNLTL